MLTNQSKAIYLNNLVDPKFFVKRSKAEISSLTIRNHRKKKVNIYKGSSELVDISSSDEEPILEKAYIPLLRYEIPTIA